MQMSSSPNQSQHTERMAELRLAGLEKVIESIISISTYEAEELKKNQTFDIATTNMRKARLLLDFNSAVKDVETINLPSRLIERLKFMQVTLRRSLRQYQFHASAIREVSNMIMEANQAQQGDGTYSARRSL